MLCRTDAELKISRSLEQHRKETVQQSGEVSFQVRVLCRTDAELKIGR